MMVIMKSPLNLTYFLDPTDLSQILSRQLLLD